MDRVLQDTEQVSRLEPDGKSEEKKNLLHDLREEGRKLFGKRNLLGPKSGDL